MMDKLQLKNITLACIDTRNHASVIKAIQQSIKKIEFGKVFFFTDKSLFSEYYETIVIPEITSKEGYSNFIIKELPKYIETEFVIIIQYDGYIIHPELWDKEFLNYDYIGASWWYDDEFNVGNGGFSLRSNKLLKIVKELSQNIENVHPEDDYLCRRMGKTLKENYNIRFAPENIAEQFSYEPNGKHPKFLNNTFGFHGIPQFIL